MWPRVSRYDHINMTIQDPSVSPKLDVSCSIIINYVIINLRE